MRLTVALLCVLAACAPGGIAQADLRPRGTELRVVVLPIEQPGERVPSRRQLDRTMQGARAWFNRATYRRIRLSWAIAPPVPRPPAGLEGGVTRHAMRRATARGVPTAGAIPVLIEATRQSAASYGNPGEVQIRGTSWRSVGDVVHELGHALGLDHARAPTRCPRPFRPLRCADRPRIDHEYGDTLDVMGGGADRYGAYGMGVLGLARVRDAPPGRSTTALRPLDGRRPTLLRLRTASRDYFADTRRRGRFRDSGWLRAPRGVAISRAPARYVPDPLFPRSQRIPASDPEVPCTAERSTCLRRQIFRPGRSLTIPGTVRLRVLRGGVATTWLDRTPPALTLLGARIGVPAGAPPQLVLRLGAAPTGAGVLRVEVDQGGVVTRVDADDVPGLVAGRRGRGTVRVPLGGAPVARVRLRDAAGNLSAPVDVDLASLPSRAAATVTFDPPLGSADATATPLDAGQVVTMTGQTDPALAGAFVKVEAIGTAEPWPDLHVGADGTFSYAWGAPEPGLYTLQVQVPVVRAGDVYVTETFRGHLRG